MSEFENQILKENKYFSYCKVIYEITQNTCNDYDNFVKTTKVYNEEVLYDLDDIFEDKIDENDKISFLENPNDFIDCFNKEILRRN